MENYKNQFFMLFLNFIYSIQYASSTSEILYLFHILIYLFIPLFLEGAKHFVA